MRRSIAFCLEHGEARLLLADREFHATIAPALEKLGAKRPIVIDIADAETAGAPRFGGVEYEDFIASGDPAFAYAGPEDEWDSICLLYTSGTTGNPKGAVYSHRGAYLGALANALTFKLDHESRYLWTLPMFHCSGWTYTWAVTAAGGTHVCLRKVEPKRIFDCHRRASHHAHVRGADRAQHAGARAGRRQARPAAAHQGGDRRRRAAGRRHRAHGGDGLRGAAPLRHHRELRALHLLRADVGVAGAAGRRALRADGPPGHPQSPHRDRAMVADPKTLEPMPRDGATIGEMMLAGNTLMKGYLKNEAATEEAFAGGFYHSGDLAVWHGDGSIEVKDRSKDIIISGGENISSLEVEEVLYRHPQVMEAAVVARSDEKWGEHPCAFVTLKPDSGPGHAGGHHRLLPRQHGALQGAPHGRVRAAAQDLDRQDPEVRPARAGQEPGVTRRSSAP